MKIELSEGTGLICSILNNPHWVETCASPDYMMKWQINLRLGKRAGKTLARGMEITLTGSGVFTENGFSLTEPFIDGCSGINGWLYTGFHNPVSSGEISISSKGEWTYAVGCEGELEFDLRGELNPKTFSASGEVSLDYVSVRGLLSEPTQKLEARFSAHYDIAKFLPPVSGNSVEYRDGERSQELIYRPSRALTTPQN